MKKLTKSVAIMMGAVLVSTSLIGCSNQTTQTESKEQKKEEFTPKLDTQKSENLDIAGFFGNFEALDQVVNNFNEYYPNVTVSYNQNGGDQLAEYLQNNSYVDIFMTNYDNLSFPEFTEKYAYDSCVDLSKEDIDFSAIDSKMLDACKVDGSLVRIPMGQILHGVVVNKTLLEKENLKVPTNYNEFLEVSEALKEKGYTPIQGSSAHLYSDLIVNMAMAEVGNNKELKDKINSGDGSATKELKPVFERLEQLIDKGYTDYDINETYPQDNYDEAILKFFEGNVPFWVCDTEKVSGMKKRESKSEAFTKNPFEYEFMYAPMGDKGCFEYIEPWYGFSVNKNSDAKDYAIEFIRFLVTEKQINTMAEIKGVPSVAINSSDERYNNVKNPSNVELSYINDGGASSLLRNSIEVVATSYGQKKLKTLDDAMKTLEEYCTK